MAVIGNSSTQQAFTPAIDYFSGNGSTTAFTLSRPVASVAQVQVTIDNVAQNPSSAYTISGSTITFTSAPLSGTNNIYVYYTSPITQVIAPGQGTVTTTSMASSTGTGAGVFQTSPTITTPVISSLSSAASTALTLQSAGTTAVTIDTSQNVGINQTSPTVISTAKQLAIKAPVNGDSLFVAQNSNSLTTFIAGYYGVTAGPDKPVVGSYSNDPVAFITNNTERMRINSSGIVSVGTTLTDNPLGGFVLYVANQNSQFMVGHETGSSSGNAYAKFCLNGSNIGSITQVGTTAVAYNTSSDYRLKENIAPLTGALAKVAQLKPVTYTWKSAPDETGEGFIAHELQEVCPQAVTGHKNAVDENGDPKYQAIDTSFLVATLTAAIQ